LTNESIFALKKYADEVAKTENVAVSDRQPMNSFFANLSVPLATHKDLRYAKTIIVCGGDPDEEQTFTAKEIRQAVRNDKANLIVINEIPIRLTRLAKQFIHVNEGAINAWPVTGLHSNLEKFGVEQSELDTLNKTIAETEGDVVFVVGSDLAPEVQAALASMVKEFVTETRRVLLHPLPLYNNSVGAIDIAPIAKSVDDVIAASNALLIGGSLQDASRLAGKDFIAVQELFLTETTDHADVVFPAASFAEVDGTFTNNAGNVQRVRKAIEPLHQSKPDWMITSQLAKEIGVDLGFGGSASTVFKTVTESVAAYAGLRYPDLKDESKPVQAKHGIVSNAVDTEALKKLTDAIPNTGTKNTQVPKIGYKLHRLTTMTSKTPQFHLLAHGNPKPENLLVSPLVQFNPDGTPRELGLAEAATVGVGDRSNTGGR
jgi:predicted molibdopterin-dependent oxidoreductase YjgC